MIGTVVPWASVCPTRQDWPDARASPYWVCETCRVEVKKTTKRSSSQLDVSHGTVDKVSQHRLSENVVVEQNVKRRRMGVTRS